jgi:hypothetical protein
MGSDDVTARLAGWREAEKNASPGPWEVTGIGDDDIWSDALGGFVAETMHPNDAPFIVTARTAMPRLLAAVEAALAHHVEAVIEDMPVPRFRYCKTCSGHPKWPCPEVAAITGELLGNVSEIR